MVLGLGNEFRHDDAVGIIAARRLREQGIVAEEHGGDLVTLIDRWKGTDGLILIDAVVSGAVPGTRHRLDVSDSVLPREFFRGSTHVLSLADAVELSRTLGTLPGRVLVFGIEARDLTTGIGLSPEVERALPLLLEEVCRANTGQITGKSVDDFFFPCSCSRRLASCHGNTFHTNPTLE